jgi:catechol 2,3-dioxygenase-like lactoylglutathione lyase family enzyme
MVTEKGAAGAVDAGHIGLTVTDLDRSLRFYRDRLGLEPAGRSRTTHEQTRRVLGDLGMELEMAVLRLPNTNAYLQLLRFGNPVRTPIDPLHGNPGTCHVAFYTDDLDETWATLEATGSENQGDGITLIEGGVFDGGRCIYCTDPDGIRVEFLEGPAYLDGSVRDLDAVAKDSRANETSHAGLHVADLDRSLAFWVEGLGFEVAAKFVAQDPGTRSVIGLPEADLNMAILHLPGTDAYMEVIEYRNAPGRHPVDPDHFNPNACHVAVYVDDLDAAWGRLEAAGSRLVSDGMVTLVTGPMTGGRVVCCTDPDGFRVELIESDRYLDGSARSA